MASSADWRARLAQQKERTRELMALSQSLVASADASSSSAGAAADTPAPAPAPASAAAAAERTQSQSQSQSSLSLDVDDTPNARSPRTSAAAASAAASAAAAAGDDAGGGGGGGGGEQRIAARGRVLERLQMMISGAISSSSAAAAASHAHAHHLSPADGAHAASVAAAAAAAAAAASTVTTAAPAAAAATRPRVPVPPLQLSQVPHPAPASSVDGPAALASLAGRTADRALMRTVESYDTASAAEPRQSQQQQQQQQQQRAARRGLSASMRSAASGLGTPRGRSVPATRAGQLRASAAAREAGLATMLSALEQQHDLVQRGRTEEAELAAARLLEQRSVIERELQRLQSRLDDVQHDRARMHARMESLASVFDAQLAEASKEADTMRALRREARRRDGEQSTRVTSALLDERAKLDELRAQRASALARARTLQADAELVLQDAQERREERAARIAQLRDEVANTRGRLADHEAVLSMTSRVSARQLDSPRSGRSPSPPLADSAQAFLQSGNERVHELEMQLRIAQRELERMRRVRGAAVRDVERLRTQTQQQQQQQQQQQARDGDRSGALAATRAAARRDNDTGATAADADERASSYASEQDASGVASSSPAPATASATAANAAAAAFAPDSLAVEFEQRREQDLRRREASAALLARLAAFVQVKEADVAQLERLVAGSAHMDAALRQQVERQVLEAQLKLVDRVELSLMTAWESERQVARAELDAAVAELREQEALVLRTGATLGDDGASFVSTADGAGDLASEVSYAGAADADALRRQLRERRAELARVEAERSRSFAQMGAMRASLQMSGDAPLLEQMQAVDSAIAMQSHADAERLRSQVAELEARVQHALDQHQRASPSRRSGPAQHPALEAARARARKCRDALKTTLESRAAKLKALEEWKRERQAELAEHSASSMLSSELARQLDAERTQLVDARREHAERLQQDSDADAAWEHAERIESQRRASAARSRATRADAAAAAAAASAAAAAAADLSVPGGAPSASGSTGAPAASLTFEQFCSRNPRLLSELAQAYGPALAEAMCREMFLERQQQQRLQLRMPSGALASESAGGASGGVGAVRAARTGDVGGTPTSAGATIRAGGEGRTPRAYLELQLEAAVRRTDDVTEQVLTLERRVDEMAAELDVLLRASKMWTKARVPASAAIVAAGGSEAVLRAQQAEIARLRDMLAHQESLVEQLQRENEDANAYMTRVEREAAEQLEQLAIAKFDAIIHKLELNVIELETEQRQLLQADSATLLPSERRVIMLREESSRALTGMREQLRGLDAELNSVQELMQRRRMELFEVERREVQLQNQLAEDQRQESRRLQRERHKLLVRAERVNAEVLARAQELQDRDEADGFAETVDGDVESRALAGASPRSAASGGGALAASPRMAALGSLRSAVFSSSVRMAATAQSGSRDGYGYHAIASPSGTPPLYAAAGASVAPASARAAVAAPAPVAQTKVPSRGASARPAARARDARSSASRAAAVAAGTVPRAGARGAAAPADSAGGEAASAADAGQRPGAVHVDASLAHAASGAAVDGASSVVLQLRRFVEGFPVLRKSARDTTVVLGTPMAVCERVFALSADLTRLELRLPGKHVPEQFVRIEHVMSIRDNEAPPDFRAIMRDGGVVKVQVADREPWVLGVAPAVTHAMLARACATVIEQRANLHRLRWQLK